MDQQAVLKRAVAWARHDDNIRVLVLTGSVARGEGAFDELSDLDIELYATDPSELLEHEAWYHQFGEDKIIAMAARLDLDLALPSSLGLRTLLSPRG